MRRYLASEHGVEFGSVLAVVYRSECVVAAFSRFGDPKMSKPENKAFAQMFQKNFAGRFLELYMKLLSVVRENGYLPDRVINLALQYLSTRYGEVSAVTDYSF